MPNDTQPSTSGTGNRRWYIIGGVIIVLLIGWFAMRSAGFMAMRASGVDVDQHMDGSATYTSDEGSVTVGGGSMPQNWPSDAPGNYAGASIQYSGSSNPQTGAAGAAVVYNVNASAQAVVDHYKAELGRNGWTVTATANTGAATVLSATKDSRSFGVYIVSTGNGAVSVTAGLEL